MQRSFSPSQFQELVFRANQGTIKKDELLNSVEDLCCEAINHGSAAIQQLSRIAEVWKNAVNAGTEMNSERLAKWHGGLSLVEAFSEVLSEVQHRVVIASETCGSISGSPSREGVCAAYFARINPKKLAA